MKKARGLELLGITHDAFDKMYRDIGKIFTMSAGAADMGMTGTSIMLAVIGGSLQESMAALKISSREYSATIALEGAFRED